LEKIEYIENIKSVSELTRDIKNLLEKNFYEVEVVGEISNFKAHNSGHWYFVLKDSDAQINCAMWRAFNLSINFQPQDGLKVIALGKITVFPPKGNYQLEIKKLIPAGRGELYLLFEKLKEKLSKEGLFDQERKREIPKFPKKIGIATAKDGAALQDMLNIARRRYPLVEIILAPCRVQGEGAAESIVKSIQLLNQQDDIDVIIVGRGGGSIEDLWPFNEEIVARAIFNSKYPVISAVGHEVDFTIADFVADLRAPTPSAAMELATPNISDLFDFINKIIYNLDLNISNYIRTKKSRLDFYSKSYIMNKPFDLLNNRAQNSDYYFSKINDLIASIFNNKKNKLELIQKSLEKYDINLPLNRGFSLIYQNDKVVKRSFLLNKEKEFKIKFIDGIVEIN
jgi:exodeoxyribonuclease VII large subunit